VFQQAFVRRRSRGAQRPERARSIGSSESPDIVVPEHLLQRASSACLGTDEEVDDDDERPAQRHTEALLLAFGDTNRNCNERGTGCVRLTTESGQALDPHTRNGRGKEGKRDGGEWCTNGRLACWKRRPFLGSFAMADEERARYGVEARCTLRPHSSSRCMIGRRTKKHHTGPRLARPGRWPVSGRPDVSATHC